MRLFTRKLFIHHEFHNAVSSIHDVILGGQDGLVNVLGIVLGVSAASPDKNILVAASLAATLSGAVSMAAVAYTSTLAQIDHYKREVQNERDEINKNPQQEREELNLQIIDKKTIFKISATVGIATLVCSFVPITPFLLLPHNTAMIVSLISSMIVLFAIGAYEAKIYVGSWIKNGIQLAIIGMGSAFVGFMIGKLFNVTSL